MMMNKHYFKSLILLLSMMTRLVSADRLPDEAKRELDDYKRFVNDQTKETEKRIIRKKQDAIRSLERYERSIKNDFAKNLIKLQLVKYRNEIAAAELKINEGKSPDKNEEGDKAQRGDQKKEAREAARILDFNKSYFYKHPVEDYKHEVGELKFFANGVVNCTHRHGKSVKMSRKWKWRMKGGKVKVIADDFHGPIYVTKRSIRELNLDWKGKVNKKNVAKQR